MLTTEVVRGKAIKVVAKWRVYPTWSACILDRAKFFRDNPRYSKCWAEKTGEGWARAVAAAGYATDPEYAQKLIATIRARNLARFDTLETA
jgi:flagellar protein FlgJ